MAILWSWEAMFNINTVLLFYFIRQLSPANGLSKRERGGVAFRSLLSRVLSSFRVCQQSVAQFTTEGKETTISGSFSNSVGYIQRSGWTVEDIVSSTIQVLTLYTVYSTELQVSCWLLAGKERALPEKPRTLYHTHREWNPVKWRSPSVNRSTQELKFLQYVTFKNIIQQSPSSPQGCHNHARNLPQILSDRCEMDIVRLDRKERK